MAKNDVKCVDILEEPIAFLYIFIDDFYKMNPVVPFLEMLDAKHRAIIASKAENQKVMCRNVYMDENNGSTTGLQNFYLQIKNKIYDQYDMYPTEILLRLAYGENVAGKDWNNGVYGVGETKQYYKNFKNVTKAGEDLSQLIVGNNGELYAGRGNVTANQTIYGEDGKPIGYQYKYKDLSITTQLINGNWYAGTVGAAAKSKQYNADGTKFLSSNASSIWQSLGTYLPYVGLILSLLSWLFSSFKSNSFSTGNLFNTTNTFPNQTMDWSDKSDEGMTTSDLLLLAAAAGAVYLIASSSDDNSEE